MGEYNDGTTVYYTVLGNQDYARITDFNTTEGDVIVLGGFASEYDISVNGNTTEIYLDDSQYDAELIAILEGITDFDLNASYVNYVNGQTGFSVQPTSLPLATGSFQNFSNQYVAPVTAAPTAISTQVQSLALVSPSATALNIQQNNDTSQLLTQLLGSTPGLSGFTMELTGDARAFGTFDNDPFGLGSGIVLSTGKVQDLAGTNTSDGGFSPGQNFNLQFNKLGTIGDSGIFVADLSNVGFDISSLVIADSNSGQGGSIGRFSGFDLDAIKLSNTLATSTTEVNALPGLNVFDFSPMGTIFTPGSQRPGAGSGSVFESPDLSGTTNGLVNNGIATLNSFDSNNNVNNPLGAVSLGDGGKIGFNLSSSVSSQSPLYLYIGEVGDNGEVAAGNISVSNRLLGGLSDLSTDFGVTGSENDSISLKLEFDADSTAQFFYFQFVFSSEEFIEYGGSEFNDAFSLELNGFNMAQLNDGSAVTINNLVPSPFGPYNRDFIENLSGTGAVADQTKLDGYTKVLTFAGPIDPNVRNTLEIKIEDLRDGLLDSAVFLKAGTFGTTQPAQPTQSSVIINESAASTQVQKSGFTDSFTVALGAVPTDNVTITIAPDAQLNLGNGSNPITLTFTPDNALTPQTINVAAVADNLTEGTHTGEIAFAVSSNDTAYNDLSVSNLSVSITEEITTPVRLDGTAGRDVLNGTNQDEIITGLAGSDTITGGGGRDRFVYQSISDRGDVITDFEIGQDKIVLTELLATRQLTAASVGFTANSQGVMMTLDADGNGPDIFRPYILVQGTNVTVTTLNNSSNMVF